MRVLSRADYILLANLCQAYATLIQAQEALNKTGLLMKTSSGYVQQSPLISIITANTHIIHKLCQEFGLSPASRSRIVADQPDEVRDIRALLSMPRPNRPIPSIVQLPRRT